MPPQAPPPPPPGAPPGRRRKLTKGYLALGFGSALVIVVVASIILSMFVQVDYVIISPGRTTPINDLVAVDGHPEFPPDNEILFVTISEDTSVSAFERWQAERNPNVEIFPKQDVLGDQTPEQSDRLNQVLMRQSKDVAVLVALQELGYDVAPTATGALVAEVVDGAPADGKLSTGDTVVAVGDEAVAGADGLRELLTSRQPGDSVVLEIEAPDGARRGVDITLAANPEGPNQGKAYIGIGPVDRLDYDLPFEVLIDSGRVGGPSAGLAFTLEILDLLTPGELTGAGDVAVTGEIRPDGTVGPVGGIREKTVAVIRSGVDVFLVPADRDCGQPGGTCNFSDARDKAAGRVEVLPVGTLDAALAQLASRGGNALALGTPGAPDTG